MRRFFKNNGLTAALLLLFALSIAGHSIAGQRQFNQQQREHGGPAVSYIEYVTGGEFMATVFENWESEFFQMALYVWLTSFLFQRGSAESKDPDKKGEVDEDPRKHRHDPDAPFPVRAGGWTLKLYEHSLTLALLLLFVTSFIAHLIGSTRWNCQDQLAHGQACETTIQHVQSSRFWYESLQNWQSEFLSIAVVVVLSIFLRQKGSSESKPVHAPHSSTGR
jgi:hypothetical protein